QKIRCCKPDAWVKEEVASRQVSDDRHSGHHAFDGEVESRQSCEGPSLIPSVSDSSALRGDEGQTDSQVSDSPSQWHHLDKVFGPFYLRPTVGMTHRQACDVPSLWPSN
ncbi:hypothetical protein HAX54_052281, partial [Datura stramonium]|nr:hypothetical protein [Datura stramonium]